MYLFVFVFVVLSVLGLYTELFTMRMARIMANQSGVAQTMMAWHGAAYYLARDNWGFAIPAAGCSLSVSPPACIAGPVVLAIGNLGAAARPYLPTGYNLNAETTFNTRVYTAGGVNYLITYVTDAETKLGFTGPQIFRQIEKAKLSVIYSGIVGAGGCSGAGTWLKTKAYVGATQICYPIPAPVVATVPTGSVAILSIL